MIRGLDQLSCGLRLRELGFFSLKRTWCDPVVGLKEAYRKDREKILQ